MPDADSAHGYRPAVQNRHAVKSGLFTVDEVEPLLEAWRENEAGRAVSLIGTSNRALAGKVEKSRVSNTLNDLVLLADSGATIRDVLRKLRSVIPLPDDLETALNPPTLPADAESSIVEFFAFLAKLVEIPYAEVARYRAVFDENLPYSTKHGVKGEEFDNVIVVLDDAGANWNQYAFGKLLSGADTSESRFKRTRNLFYVCCSRARINLAVVNLSPMGDAARNISELFGEQFVASYAPRIQS